MYTLIKLFLSFCMITLGVHAMETAESYLIEPYKKERDHAFITAILAEDKHNFPDADMVADLDNEYYEMNIPQPDGSVIKCKFKQNILMCCCNAQPVGFVRTFDFSQGQPDGMGQIAQIAVVQEVRRKGIGQLLLTHGIEKLKSAGIKMVILDTMADNTAAHALYEKAGFQKMVDAGDHYLYSLQLDS